jgi:hypothetical protein
MSQSSASNIEESHDAYESVGENDDSFRLHLRLKVIELPYGLEVIEDYAFELCEKLTTVVLPKGLLHISMCAFKGCSSLECIVIPSTVNYLRMNAFLMCGKLQEVIIHDGLHHGMRQIKPVTFSMCT